MIDFFMLPYNAIFTQKKTVPMTYSTLFEVDAADRSRSRAMSVVEGSEELERPPRRTPTLCLMSMVVVGDAQHPGKLPERRVLLDLSIGACSAMYPHMLQ